MARRWLNQVKSRMYNTTSTTVKRASSEPLAKTPVVQKNQPSLHCATKKRKEMCVLDNVSPYANKCA